MQCIGLQQHIYKYHMLENISDHMKVLPSQDEEKNTFQSFIKISRLFITDRHFAPDVREA